MRGPFFAADTGRTGVNPEHPLKRGRGSATGTQAQFTAAKARWLRWSATSRAFHRLGADTGVLPSAPSRVSRAKGSRWPHGFAKQ
ncbi:hypothetical protein GCM10010360_40560 [Streptomyces nogalater]